MLIAGIYDRARRDSMLSSSITTEHAQSYVFCYPLPTFTPFIVSHRHCFDSITNIAAAPRPAMAQSSHNHTIHRGGTGMFSSCGRHICNTWG